MLEQRSGSSTVSQLRKAAGFLGKRELREGSVKEVKRGVKWCVVCTGPREGVTYMVWLPGCSASWPIRYNTGSWRTYTRRKENRR